MDSKRAWSLAAAASLYLPKSCRLHARFRPASYRRPLLVPKRRAAASNIRTHAVDLQATSPPVSCELSGEGVDATRRLMNSFFSIAVAYFVAQAPHKSYGRLDISIPLASDTLEIFAELDKEYSSHIVGAYISFSLKETGWSVEYGRDVRPEEEALLDRASLIEALDPKDHDAAIEIYGALKATERPWRGRYDYRVEAEGARSSGTIECRFEKLHWEHEVVDAHVRDRTRDLLPKRQKR